MHFNLSLQKQMMSRTELQRKITKYFEKDRIGQSGEDSWKMLLLERLRCMSRKTFLEKKIEIFTGERSCGTFSLSFEC